MLYIPEKEKIIRTAAIIKYMPKETSTKLKLKNQQFNELIILGKINENRLVSRNNWVIFFLLMLRVRNKIIPM